LAAALAIGSGVWSGVHAQGAPSPIVGSWTLVKDLSDVPDERVPGRGAARPDGGRQGGGFGRGGGRGGFGGGFPGGGLGGRGGAVERDDMVRRQEALRDIIGAPERLTIVQTESMIIVTTGDGRTTRLAPDGSKVEDESTKVERRTRWDGDKLVSEITGAAGKITEIYSADTRHHELLVIVRVEAAGRDEAARVFHRIYAAGAR
jgi:hypothetical protein